MMNNGWLRLWRVKRLRNLELSLATAQCRSLPTRVHEGFEIRLIERGAEKLFYRGASHVAPEGSLVVINPDEASSAQSADDGRWSYRAFHPTASDVHDAASEAIGRRMPMPFFSSPVIKDEYLSRIMRELHLMLEEPNQSLAQQSYALLVAAALVTRHVHTDSARVRVGKEHRAVALAREFIHANLSNNINLAELAVASNLSSFHLIRVFNQQVGLPPHAYLTQVRVNRAKQLLSFGQPIARVASETGFVDQSHFSRHFKRLVGLTPGQYSQATRITHVPDTGS